MKRKTVIIGTVVLLVMITPVSAYSLSNGTFTEGFENGFTGYSVDHDGGTASISTTKFVAGLQSLRLFDGGSYQNSVSPEITTNETYVVDNESAIEISFWVQADSPNHGSDVAPLSTGRIEITDTNGNYLYVTSWSQFCTTGVSDCAIGGNLASNEYWGVGPSDEGEEQWLYHTATIDFASDTISITEHNVTGATVTGSITGNFTGHVDITFSRYNAGNVGSSTSYNTFFDEVSISGLEETPSADDLTFEVNPYQKHGTTQKYTVTWNGTGTPTDVTDSATVTSSNISVITVNESTNELVATSNTNISKEVKITATYEGVSVSKNVTVSQRVLSEIDILPNTQWAPAVLGFDEPGTSYGLGSNIQWILVAIFTGAALAWKARNEWLGIGVIIAVMILLWALGHVGLGPTLVALFYGIFAAYQLQQTPSRLDTNIGDGL